MEDDLIYLNGIDAETGQYLIPPMTADQAAYQARGAKDQETPPWWKKFLNMFKGPLRGLPFDVEPTDVSRAGWGVIFTEETPEEVRKAFEPLIEHRAKTVLAERLKVLEVKRGEAMRDWLKRHGVYPGSIAPTKVPYYLLIVGDPASVSFEFQYLLDIEYAVGRLAFDTTKQYRQYVQSVIEYERAEAVPRAREVVYWGTRHPADRATQMSADYLITPLFEGVPGDSPRMKESGFRSRCVKAKDATKASLSEVLAAAEGPSVLFTASHGLGLPKENEKQRAVNGAILCQDWSGFGSIDASQYLSAADIGDDAHVHGLIAFVFACYGAGTPDLDPFLKNRSKGPVAVSPSPFIAALPQRLLSHPQGAALAYVGHVERAWNYSIKPPGVGQQILPFRNFLGRVLEGEPVGHATKDFSEKYASLSTLLLNLLDTTSGGPGIKDAELVSTWIERNDAQNYVLLGDPAVRLRIKDLR